MTNILKEKNPVDTFVIGDIHGRNRALIEVLKKSKFDYNKDQLIILGDIVDGGSETKQVVDTLLTIKHTIFIRGNHDTWAIDWINGQTDPRHPLEEWYCQGGKATIQSYENKPENAKHHKKFFAKSKPYHIDKQNRLYVHGGFDPTKNIKEQSLDKLTWDRTIINYAFNHNIPNYTKVFIGHTTTQLLDPNKPLQPVHLHNLIMLDTGAGWDGKLTIMNVNTEQYWQSLPQKPNRT